MIVAKHTDRKCDKVLNNSKDSSPANVAGTEGRTHKSTRPSHEVVDSGIGLALRRGQSEGRYSNAGWLCRWCKNKDHTVPLGTYGAQCGRGVLVSKRQKCKELTRVQQSCPDKIKLVRTRALFKRSSGKESSPCAITSKQVMGALRLQCMYTADRIDVQ